MLTGSLLLLPEFHQMKNPLKIMTAMIQRLRRKRKLSSELDSRWGDMAISSPNEGSWSQYDAASTRASPASVHSSEHRRKQSTGESAEQPYEHVNGVYPENRKGSVVNFSSTMPTGYYDARVRQRSKTKSRSPEPQQTVQHAPITLPKAWEEKMFGDSSADEAGDDLSALGSPRAAKPATDGSKSPPLSVTSRMRRLSGQSTVTDAIFSMPGTASSQRTSFSLDDSRLARQVPHHEKKPPQRAKVRDAEPTPVTQQLVPSYDELYG
ncbi:uncharacterized protein BJX67DRAFT_279148 [Aspergillus lucknowensis]|uniref:Uncharacterized protein n=1 Tax=Aspergillus lucknowensis TaxID=176173 RepID=A0ABR4M0E1_9EURO